MSAMPEEPPKPSPDVVVLHSKTEDGKGVRVIRGRDGKIELGEMRPLVSGQPIVQGEIVALRPRENTPWVCDVQHSVKVDSTAGDPVASNGSTKPAQVATDAYRTSWDRIFGAPVPSHDMN